MTYYLIDVVEDVIEAMSLILLGAIFLTGIEPIPWVGFLFFFGAILRVAWMGVVR